VEPCRKRTNTMLHFRSSEYSNKERKGKKMVINIRGAWGWFFPMQQFQVNKNMHDVTQQQR
jgi:hypothetical protein